MTPKHKTTLGKPSGSLNAPIAAFTMAIVLCSYCFSSIRSARREAQSSQSDNNNHIRAGPLLDRQSQSSWVQQALEEQKRSPK
ncbi:hypothetical protein ASPWEDRAFT_34682 [Aspergillus wentii DTO 134E9]|uniref:Uncharacterized protein n=1 Tax=Aspergillus wentii DTO 134E9 TaxID=1073089 RepID=A0A1L9S1Z5_ASPWE|nr:uncharacterized protein ASPWEDRAFT_34682 [Aspergillus wentii DTO 134E9]KAI9923957.1 hypothetical protein MW887_007415 [Aspergillus wentii]OJJ41183.1 hypothetical protein ASPWEDRAFT_34682 [Aspergillus wentii DTO 134E9]